MNKKNGDHDYQVINSPNNKEKEAQRKDVSKNTDIYNKHQSKKSDSR
jgi:hypothetical protein